MTTIIGEFIKKVAARFDRSEKRIISLERQLQDLMRKVPNFTTSIDTAHSVPGSEVLTQEQIIPVKIVSEDPANTDKGMFVATVQMPTGFGTFQNWTEDGELQQVVVRAYPVNTTGNLRRDYPYIAIGSILPVRWEGRDDTHEFYHLQCSPPGFSAKLIECSTSSPGWGHVRQVTGVGAESAMTEVSGAPLVTVYMGQRSHIRKGRIVQCVPRGPGCYPHWQAFRPIYGITYLKPTSIDSAQTVPSEETARCAGGVST